MTNEEIAVKMEDHEHEIGLLKHRMKAVEESTGALHKLATAMEIFAVKQDNMSKNLEKLTGKVERLEEEPAKKWKFVVEKSICFIVGAILTYFLSRVGF